jgi:hypothetical protein
MALEQNIVSQFSKLLNNKKENSEVTLNGTFQKIGDKNYVRIDGSDILTPVETVVEAETDERVKVQLKNHIATVIANTTSPMARTKSLDKIKDTVDKFGNTIKQMDTNIEQQNTSIKQFESTLNQYNTTINQHNTIINQQKDTINSINNTVNSQNNVISEMNNKVTSYSNSINSINNTITQHNNDISSINNTIRSYDNKIEANSNEIRLHGNKIEAHGSEIESQNSRISIINSAFTIQDGVLTGLSEIILNKLKTQTLDTGYAKIDFANINQAAIKKVFADSGIIKDLITENGKITGELVGVTIKGDLIKTGTLIADKLVIKGSDGLYYKLNTNGEKVESQQTDSNSLNGSIITAKSITASKIQVTDLVAFGATIGGFEIDNNSIHSHLKTSIDSNEKGLYLEKTGQIAIGDNDNYIKYYKNNDGQYILDIKADNIKFGSESKTLEGELKKIEKTTKEIQNEVKDKNVDKLLFNSEIKIGKQKLPANRLIVSNEHGYHAAITDTTFDFDSPILLNGISSDPLTKNKSAYLVFPNVDLRKNAYKYYENGWNNATIYNPINLEMENSNHIYYGNKITGDSETPKVFNNSEINSILGDIYLNIDNGNYYECVKSGDQTIAEWIYKGTTLIKKDKRIYYGNHLTHENEEVKNTETNISNAFIGSKYINTDTGRLYECVKEGVSGVAEWKAKDIVLEPNKNLYLVGKINGKTITINDVPFTTKIPTKNDDNIYITLGITGNKCYIFGLTTNHILMKYHDGIFRPIDDISLSNLNIAKENNKVIANVKQNVERFLEGDNETTLSILKSRVTSEINSATGQIVDNFESLIGNTSYGTKMDSVSKDVISINSFIKRMVNKNGQPCLELGVQPTPDIPKTYRLRIENDKIYMVYGSGDSDSLIPLTKWYTKDGKSGFEVNTLITQQEMAIEPFRFIKNSDGSISFRKVD